MTAIVKLPDPNTLTLDQLKGHACARCGYRLYQSVRVGTVTSGSGVHATRVDLWVCPACASPKERQAHAAETAGQRVGWCGYCDRWASDAVPVGFVAGNSGPGWTQYAHRSCAQERGVWPLDKGPLPPPLPRRVRRDAIRRATAEVGQYPDLIQRLPKVLPDIPEFTNGDRTEVWERIREGLAQLSDTGGTGR